uniref:Uncharacterized protein n=1 Tax=Fervidobacterium pennivorans TaxID=93466 RepID=A0A7V4NEJ8_FERPE
MLSVAFSGAILFFLSDLLLSYDKYVKRIPNRDLLVLSLYFAGQLLITLSVVLQSNFEFSKNKDNSSASFLKSSMNNSILP